MGWTLGNTSTFFDGLKKRAKYDADTAITPGSKITVDGGGVYIKSEGKFADNLGFVNNVKGSHVRLFNDDAKLQMLAYPEALQEENGPKKDTDTEDKNKPTDVSAYIPSGNSFTAFFIESSQPKSVDSETGEPKDLGIAVRRPLLGLMPKANTYAAMFVTSQSNTGKDFRPSPSDDVFHDSLYGEGNKQKISFNFLLDNVSQSYSENTQIIQTFGKTYYLFFGEKPTTIRCHGFLLNSRDFNWKYDFLRTYQESLRGSKLALKSNEVVLAYDDMVLSGYILNLSLSDQVEYRELCDLSFDMVITRFSIIQDTEIYKIPGKKPMVDKNSTLPKGQESFVPAGAGIQGLEGLGPQGAGVGGEVVVKESSSPGMVPDPNSISRSDFEWAGTWGPTNAQGTIKETQYSMKLFTPFHKALTNIVGFDVRNIQRIESLIGLVGHDQGIKGLANPDINPTVLLTTGLVALSSKAQQEGCHIYELDKVVNFRDKFQGLVGVDI